MLVQADLRQFPAHSERHEKHAEHVVIEVAHAGCLRRRDAARPCEAAVPCISVICTTAARLRPCQKVRPWPHFWAARIYMKSVPCPENVTPNLSTCLQNVTYTLQSSAGFTSLSCRLVHAARSASRRPRVGAWRRRSCEDLTSCCCWWWWSPARAPELTARLSGEAGGCRRRATGTMRSRSHRRRSQPPMPQAGRPAAAAAHDASRC